MSRTVPCTESPAQFEPPLRSSNRKRTALEFFAGIGLMQVGLERHGWSVVYANDIDPDKQEIYLQNFPESKEHFKLGDIHLINQEELPDALLATASFPCNDLSIAGSMVGLNGKQSSAFWGFVRLLKEMGERRPPIVLIENVVGFLMSHRGNDFSIALKALNELGYSVDAFIIDAERFVPQSRKRLFVVGNMFGPKVEQPLVFESEIRPKRLVDFMARRTGIKWNIRALPPLPERKCELKDIVQDLPPESPEWWPEERASYLLNQMSPRHREIADKMMRGRNWSFGTVFRRVRHGKSMAELRVDGIAGCLRTPRGGSGRQILFMAGKGKYFARLLTPHECARLMGVEKFVLDVPLNQALFGFGDAVCVSVIEWIAKHYLNPIANELQQQLQELPRNGKSLSSVNSAGAIQRA